MYENMEKPFSDQAPVIAAHCRQAAALGCRPPRKCAVRSSAMNSANASKSSRVGGRRIRRGVSSVGPSMRRSVACFGPSIASKQHDRLAREVDQDVLRVRLAQHLAGAAEQLELGLRVHAVA